MANPDDEPVVASGERHESEVALPEASSEALGDIQSYIGARLRQAFDDVAQQPVPDRFLQLMQQLDKA